MYLTQEKAVDLRNRVTPEMAVGWKTNGFCQENNEYVSLYDVVFVTHMVEFVQ
jgi:hypothetical protein